MRVRRGLYEDFLACGLIVIGISILRYARHCELWFTDKINTHCMRADAEICLVDCIKCRG